MNEDEKYEGEVDFEGEKEGIGKKVRKLPPAPVAAAVVVLVLAGVLGGYFLYQRYFGRTAPEEVSAPATQTKVPKLDPQKEKTHLSRVADTQGAYFARAFDLFWGDVETQRGKFDWSLTDEQIRWLNEEEIYPLVIVKPFALWDQESCHPEERYEAEFDPRKGYRIKVGKPCDLIAFGQFLEKAVERYDGDGIEDMPGLTIPIKYWEIMNEPTMQGGVTGGMGEELKFFVGTSKDYLEILKTSYQAIKKADPEAKVLHAGMAGMDRNFRDFWRPVFAQGGGQYFDIANIHTISTDQRREDLFVIRFKRFLQEFGLQGKPIWITEVQFGRLAEKPEDLESFEILVTKASVFALAQGTDKLIYISNWTDFWPSFANPLRQGYEGQEASEGKEEMKKEKKFKVSPEVLASSTHQVYLNLVDKVNQFDRIEKIKEEYIENQGDHDGATSNIGQYKFVSGDKSVYVLWGQAELPAEISGQVRVTDIYGQTGTMDASLINLSAAPIFVEPSR